jgi:hypothetical protein
MPLSAAVGGLLTGIETAYNNAVENGAKEDNSSGTQESLGADMGEAIDQYYSQAFVSTNVTINAGQSDTVGGSTTVDGTGTGTGFLEDLDISTLKSDLETAYSTAATTGESDDPIPQLAQDVSDAVHKYMTSGTVITSVVANGGQTTSAAAGTANPIGAVSAPGTGTGEGIVRFESGDVSTLKSDLETAYNNAKKNGESGSTLEPLALDVHSAIHLFALTAIVETDVTVFPGQVVAGYMVLVGTAASPLPATTLITTAASGEGELS